MMISEGGSPKSLVVKSSKFEVESKMKKLEA